MRRVSLFPIHAVIVMLMIGLAVSTAVASSALWPTFQHDAQHTGRSEFVGPDTAGLKWTFQIPNQPQGPGQVPWRVASSPVIGSDGTIYVGATDGGLYAINPNGSQKWVFTASAPINATSAAIDANGVIYVGSDDYNLYAVDSNGQKIWAFQTSYIVNSAPVIAPDGTIYLSSGDSNLYAINPNGGLIWTFPTGNSIQSSPALGADGTIYVGSDDHNLYAVNPDGSQKWAFPTTNIGGDLRGQNVCPVGNAIVSSPAVGPDGTIYVGGCDRAVYAINPNGTQKWIFTAGLPFESSPVVSQSGMLYIGCDDGNLYALDSDTGAEEWYFPTNGAILASPVIGSDGNIFFSSYDCNVYSVSDSGQQRWVFPTDDYIKSSPVIAPGKMLYVGSGDGNLYAIGQGFRITPTSGENGSISPNVQQTVDYDSSVTFTATPSTGFAVDVWKVDGALVQTGGTKLTLTSIIADHTVDVAFKVATFTVTPSAAANGTISPNTPQTVEYGGSIGFTATPKPGYMVSQWNVDGNPAQTGGLTFNLSNVTAKHSVWVYFKLQTYTLTPSSDSNGTISPSTPQTVNNGGKFIFLARANTGYTLGVWTVDNVPAQTGGQTFTLSNITADHTVHVTFNPITFTVTPSSGANGSISPNTAQTVNYGKSISFTATPALGYTVVGWTVDGASAQTGGTGFTLSNVLANHKVNVTFKKLTFTITPSSGANGSISPSVQQTINYGSSVAFTATPSTGFTVDVWRVDNAIVQTGGTRLTLSNVTANHTVDVQFKILTFAVTPSAAANGAISPNTVQTVSYGGAIGFTATPKAGYMVSTWNVDGNIIQTGGLTFTLSNVTAKHSVWVYFKLQTFTLTPSAGVNGTISPSTPQTVSSGGKMIFLAIPSSGHTVGVWTVDGSPVQTGGQTYTLSNITADHAINVTFN